MDENIISFEGRYKPTRKNGLKVRDVLHRNGFNLHKISSAATIGELSFRFRGAQTPVMAVTDDDGMLVGFVTAQDIARGVAQYRNTICDVSVGDLMTSKVVTCFCHDTLADAVALMTTHGISHLPVVSGDRSLVGIISRWHLIEMRLGEIEAKSNRLKSWFAEPD